MLIWTITTLSTSLIGFLLGRCWEDLKTDMDREDAWSVAFMLVGIFLIVFIGGVLDGS